MNILLALLILIVPVQIDDKADVSWPSSLHQKVIVKATGLMPESIQRRILIHRGDILRGCVDTLKKGISAKDEIVEIKLSYGRLVKMLKSKRLNFRMISYEMGRLSAFLSEASSPLRSPLAANHAHLFGRFVLSQSSSFPLIITHSGEGFLQEKDLTSYLKFQQNRKDLQKRQLAKAIRLYPDSRKWKQQRSLQFGIASVVFNDMILDTSRIWMLAWEEAGGTVADAPYFTQGKN